MVFEDADEITYEMSEIQRKIIMLKNKSIRSWQEQRTLEMLQTILTYERKRLKLKKN